MTFIDTVLLAVGNLWRRKTRTFLTVLGVIIGTACIIIMVALGLGSLEQFNETVLQSNDLTLIEVYQGYSSDSSSSPKLNENALEKMKNIPGVRSATGVLQIPAFIKMGKYEYYGSVSGVDPDAMNFNFMEGELFTDTDAVEFVMGAGTRQWFTDPRAAQDYGYGGVMVMGGDDYEEPTGPDVEWLEQSLKYYPYYGDGSDLEATPDTPVPKEYKANITGVLEPSNDMNHYSMFISMPAAKKLIRENRKLMDSMGVKEDVYSTIYVNAQDVDSVEGVLNNLKEMGYQVYSPTEWITQMQDEYGRQQSQLIAIALISLLVSAIGIANTMLASILERRQEIGVMKVIGLSIRKINLMFLVEAALIGLLGGIIAIVASYIVAAAANTGGGEMNFLGMYFAEGVRITIPWWLSMGALAIATGIGIVSGIYPAWRATRMSPLEAIRGSN